jgi:hypothetical protein
MVSRGLVLAWAVLALLPATASAGPEAALQRTLDQALAESPLSPD